MDKEDDQLLQQFHFYFSDSNLAKDKFLKEKITENEGGWVPLSLFMTFNKVKELTNDPKKICEILRKSTFLEISEDQLKIRRKAPYLEKEIPVDHFIYVEHLPLNWNHENVRSFFERIGSVNHVSLPRDRKSRQFMGYGFVEFSSAAEAKKALTLSGHTEPSWESSLVVMSKAAWEQRKRDRHNVVTPLSTEDTPVPLYVSHIPSDATVKSIRNLFCMFGPVLHVSLWSAESSLLVENTCIVEFTCSLCAERCMYYLKHFKQCMIPGESVQARRLTESEESLFRSLSTAETRQNVKRSGGVEDEAVGKAKRRE